MQKWISTLSLGLALLSNAAANAGWDCWDCQSNVRFDIGYRHDDYEWRLRLPSFEGNECKKDELRCNFDDVHVLQLGIHADGTFCSCITARGDAHIGWILDGNQRERLRFILDSHDGVHEAENHEIKNLIDGRNTVDISLALGYPIHCWNNCWVLSPVVGYSYKSQYVIVDRNQRFRLGGGIDDASVEESKEKLAVLKIDNCHDDKWINKWYGPFIGLDMLYDSCDCLRLYGQFEVHFARFKGKRQTGHDIDEVEFIRNLNVSSRKNTHGYLFRVGGEHDLSECFYVGLEGMFQKFTANKKLRFCEFEREDRGCRDSKGRFTGKIHSWGVKLTFGGKY